MVYLGLKSMVFSKTRPVSLVLAAVLALTACGDDRTRPNALVNTPGNGAYWSGIVAEARLDAQQNPNKSEFRTALLSAVQGAEDFYLKSGRGYQSQNDMESAEGTFSKGLLVVPESQMLRDALEELKQLKQSRALMAQGKSSLQLGRTDRAVAQLEQALQLDPNNREALNLLNRAYGSSPIHTAPKPIRLKSSAAVTVNFRDADMKEAFLTLGKNYGLNTIFDSGLEDQDVTLYAENVSFDQAFRLMLKATGNHFRPMGDNSMLIFRDTPEGRASNTDFHVRTFYLESAPAEQMQALVERVFDVPNISASSQNNALTIRTTRQKLALADRLIRANDRAQAEVSLEVEILEFNRTKSENLGVNFGSQITISPPTVTLGDIRSGAADAQLASSVVTLPASSIQFFKQDVDARTLASPRIRTVSQKLATIHIGDRVPLRAATVLDANGQSRTSFEYRDIGIKLEVTPKVLLDNSTDVSLNLEVSSLGQNLGTADESAFSIGTRNIETNMVLNNNETAIIGGLIRGEERVSTQSVPGLGEIPVVGRLFQVRDGQGTRTDILLTLTPRIVKGWDIPSPADTEFFSGTGDRVGSENEFAFLDTGAPGGAVIRLDLDGNAKPAAAIPSPVVAVPSSLPQPTQAAVTGAATAPSLGFGSSVYEVADGNDLTIRVDAAGFSAGAKGDFRIRFNKNIVEVKSASGAGNSSVSFDNAAGEITVDGGNLGSGAAVATVTLTGKQAGLSYFLIEMTNPPAGSGAPNLGSAKIVAK